MYLSYCTAGETHLPLQNILPHLLTSSTTSSSAGVGRTGTFIALDITLDKMNAEKTVDIKGTMEKMREKRMYMIQTVVGVRSHACTCIMPI